MTAPVDITGVRLETSRLILRPWRYDEAEDLFDYVSIEGLGQMAGWLPHKSIEESAFVLNLFIEGKKTFAIELKETGRVFAAVLEDAGVYKSTPEGREAFLRFVDCVNDR